MPFLTRLHGIAGPGPKVWTRSRPEFYRDPRTGRIYCMPPGSITDLASIPRIARPLIPGNGLERQAAGLHDRVYETVGRIAYVLNPEDFPAVPDEFDPWWGVDPADPWKPTPVEAHLWDMWEHCQIQIGYAELTRAESDSLFNQANRCSRVNIIERPTMYSAVRLGGWVYWNSNERTRNRDPDAFDARHRVHPSRCRTQHIALIDWVDV